MSHCDRTTAECQNHESCSTETQACLPEVCCPVEKSVEKWSGSFFEAMKQTQVEILKEKIRKSWGSQMDKVADAVIEAMGVYWHSTLTQAKAQLDLRENIKKIFQSGKS